MFMFILTGRAPKVHFPLLLRKPLEKVAEEKKMRSKFLKRNFKFKLLLCVKRKKYTLTSNVFFIHLTL